MRTKNVIRNILASVGSYAVLFFLNILVRKCFLFKFDVELLGYEGLFGSIFLILSIAEMGANSMFDYMLYEALAKKDMDQLGVIMDMYKKLYRIIGVIVLILGGLVYFILPFVITDDVSDWGFVRTIYLIQLGGTLITYFLAYRRALFAADQKSYLITKIDTIYKFVSSAFRIGAILLISNYIVYLTVPVITNLLSNIRISSLTKKSYEGIFSHKANWNDFKEKNAFFQLKNLIVHKISTVVYNTSDNFIISTILGMTTMGLYSNYQMLTAALSQMLLFFTGAIGSSTGNLMHSESQEKKLEFYYIIDFISFLIGLFCMVEMVVCFQKTVIFLYGNEYLLADIIPFILGVNFYVNCRGIGYGCLQGSVGHYETVRNYSIMSAFLNVFFSILFGLKYGIAGVLSATIIGNCFIQAGRAAVVFSWLFIDIKKREIIKEVIFFGVACLISFVLKRLFDMMGANPISIIFCLIATFLCVIVFVVVLFRRSKTFRLVLNYASGVVDVFKRN